MGKYGKQFKTVVKAASQDITDEQKEIVYLQCVITTCLNKLLVAHKLPQKKNFMQAVKFCYKHNLITEYCKSKCEELNESACYVKHELVQELKDTFNQA